METAIVVYTRDLRVHDNPALAQACEQADRVVPLFVVDERLAGSPNRDRFLHDSLDDLRRELRARGGDLVIRHGDPVAETVRLARETAAGGVFIADDVSGYAARRRKGLEAHLNVTVTPGPTVVPPGALRPTGGDHYKVFTPYWRAWTSTRWRDVAPAPARIDLPEISVGRLPDAHGTPSPALMRGGENAGRERAHQWLRDSLAGYGDARDDLAADETSRLSAYLRFGCVSALELACTARDHAGGPEFCRQLAWRDFHHQVTAAFPTIAREDYRPRGTQWNDDQDALDAWREGRTGVPIVDAGMRQLAAEGFLHNRARMIVASFLTRNLRIDWRHGYRHFGHLLADGDLADNAGNWQWVAGTGNDTRPNRVMNPIRQARRYDPTGDYVRRYVPELADVDTSHIHEPWQHPPVPPGYPLPIIDLG